MAKNANKRKAHRASNKSRLAKSPNSTAFQAQKTAGQLQKLSALLNESKLGDASTLAKSIAKANPNAAELLEFSATALMHIGEHENAVILFERALENGSNSHRLLNNLGSLYLNRGMLAEAENAIKRAIIAAPKYANAHNNLGNVYSRWGRAHAAQKSYEAALNCDPGYDVARLNLGSHFLDNGQLEGALEIQKFYIGCKTNDYEALFLCGAISMALKEHSDAITFFSKALVENPSSGRTHHKIALCELRLSKPQSALRSMKKAWELGISNPNFNSDYGLAYCKLERFDQAKPWLLLALNEQPKHADALINLAVATRQSIADKKTALDICTEAVKAAPRSLPAHSNLCFTTCYFDLEDNEIFDYHRAFGRQFVQTPVELKRSQLQKHGNKLRVGYVSPDFRSHSVATFFESLLKAHNSDSVETFCYYNAAVIDETTKRLMGYSDHWRSIVGQNDQQVVDLIQDDGINVLVDLAGHTNDNRLPLFAYKPAPVQVTWLGYPNTTGLDAIDYRFTDDIADPVGDADSLHTETLIRLPQGMWCYNGDHSVPPSVSLPYDKNGFITFGSFNNLAKVTPEVVATWANILNQVPNSRLLLKTKELVDELTQKRTIDLLKDNGIEQERVTLKASVPSKEEHLSLYSEIDIALDPFPFNGATTTCEALWMGVPVLALRGQRHVARVAASMIHRVGLDDFIAETREEYVEKAKQFANDVDYLRHLRSTMRERVASSPLCDAKSFAANVENAFAQMWEGPTGANMQEHDAIVDETNELDSRDCEKITNKAIKLFQANRIDEAAELARSAHQLNPRSFNAIDVLAGILLTQNKLEDAIQAYRIAVEIKPDYAIGFFNLGVASQDLDRNEEAIEFYNKSLAIDPSDPETLYNRGMCLGSMQERKAAISDYRAVIRLDSLRPLPKGSSKNLKARSHLCFQTCYFDLEDNEIFDYHRAFGRQFVQTPVELKRSQLQKHGNKLRVGYVSPDFRSHSVATFFESLLKAHNSDSVETFCYYNAAVIDETTKRLMGYSDHWRSIVGQNDQQVVDLIQDDGINVLVDLAGHTNDNRLPLFAYKPAPVQVTWLGYPNTTGLDAIDYRFTDDIADPVGDADSLHTETLIRLPQGMWCYNGDHSVPPSVSLPYDKNGFITFGSFNNLAKVTPEVVATWANILNQVPNSRLLLKTKELVDELTQKRTIDLLKDNGIEQERVTLKASVPSKEEHLSLYSEIDIALDPFPFNGATTTCEALWMGVPVLALRGQRHVARVAASMIHRVGLDDFIAETREEYVEKAKQFANDVDYLRHLRSTMRERVASSPLCDAKSFAANVENAFAQMWEGPTGANMQEHDAIWINTKTAQ